MPIVPQLGKPKEEDQEIKVILSYDQVQVQPELQETLSQINNNKSILLGKKEFNGVQLTLSMCIYQGNTMVSHRSMPFLTQ